MPAGFLRTAWTPDPHGPFSWHLPGRSFHRLFYLKAAGRTLGSEVIAMEATQGDRIIVHGRTVGAADRHGVILEVRGQGGTPPYRVRFDDGHETTMYPGGDFAVERGTANQA
jgi:hypothetical protein